MTDRESPETPEAPDTADAPSPPPPALDLRVARVVRAREHPDADRLLLLDVDLGGEERQVVAGIKKHYELDALEGKRVVVVTNLEPARIRGEESQGMILAAENDEGELGLLLATGAEPGTPVRPAGEHPEPGPEKISFADFQAHTLRADSAGVTLDGAPLTGAELRVDRGVEGRVR